MNMYAAHYFIRENGAVVKIFAIITSESEQSAMRAAQDFERANVEHCRAVLMGYALPDAIEGAYMGRMIR